MGKLFKGTLSRGLRRFVGRKRVPLVSLLVPCGFCKARDKGKNAWLVWAWNRADNTRVAYRQRLCSTCVQTNLGGLLVDAQDAPLSCPVCHMDAGDAMDPIYVTYILPGWGKEQAEFATCGACAVQVRLRAQEGSDLMPDREMGVGAAAPTQTVTSVWDALGLRPRS